MRLLSSGASATRFVVSVPEAKIGPAAADAKLFEITIPGYVSDGPPGAPALPARLLRVAVPPGSEPSLRVSATAGERREGVEVAPLGRLEAPRDGERGRPARMGAKGGPAGPRSGERARLLGVSWLRNQRVATVAVYPVDYEADAHRVTLFREIEVELSFGPGGSGLAQPERDPFEDVYREVLVNYESGRAWRRPQAAAGPGAVLGASRKPVFSAAQLAAMGTPSVPDTSIFVGRDWVKIAIPQTGFYKVDFGQLRNTTLFSSLPWPADSTELGRLRLFTLPGLPVLPEDNYCDGCDYREVAVRFEDQGPNNTPADGYFNVNADAVVFFALGPSDWADYYDPARAESIFVNNPYETRNYYYLTVSTPEQPVSGPPARIASVPGAVTDEGTETHPADFAARIHAEQDIEYLPDLAPNYYGDDPDVFWEKWFWRTMVVNSLFSASVSTPGADTTMVASVRVRQWGIDAVIGDDAPPSCFDDAHHLMDVAVNGQVLPTMGWNSRRPFAYEADIPIYALKGVAPNTVRVSIPSVPGCARTDRSALAWIEIRYRRKFTPVGDELTFDSPAGDGNYIYDIGPFTTATTPLVFDVTDAYAPVEISGVSWTMSPGGYRLSFETLEPGPRRYRVIPAVNIAKVPDASVAMAPSTSHLNLRSAARSADYLLIYYDGFKAAADSLAAWRTLHLPLDGGSPPFDVTTVPVSALYDQFSGGRTDPSSIRNFLRAAFFNWAKHPAFVTFLGDASYDFKNIKGLSPAGQPASLVPTYENGFDTKQFVTDDWLLNVDDPAETIPDFYGGRIPASDVRSANDFVLKKLLFYERNAPFGTWRDKVMLIADDNEQGSDVDRSGWDHLSQTSDLESMHTPSHMDRAYVYLHTYADGPGDTKPEAKADIKKTVNEGVLMFNYIGHGSPFKIADETVLSDVDAGTFTNAERPSLFVAASCDVGKFSDPTVTSLGERMVLATTGGAVAVISATEIAYSNVNAALNWELYSQLFQRRPPGGQFHQSIAQALLSAKLLNSPNEFWITNNSKYQIMGDAATRLLLPRLWVKLSLHECETCVPEVSKIERGATVYFRGQVFSDSAATNPVALDGAADMLIEESAPLEHAPPCSYCFSHPDYWFRAGPMFRGDVRVTGGALQGSFVVPIEARGGPRGRVRGYVSGRAPEGEIDGVGSSFIEVDCSRDPSGNCAPPVSDDQEGPRITLSFASGSTVVRPNSVLRIDLQDPSGILITGHSLQNGIVVTLDGNTTARVDATSSFRYLNGSHTTGTASWQLPNLSAGEHQIRVSAADNLAAGLTASLHRSSATIGIKVADIPPLQVVNAFLFPNPARSGSGVSGGKFVVDALGDSVNALLRIYTVSGRMVRSLESFRRQGQIQIPWDGLDSQGYPLANGTYFFRVQLNLRDELGESSARSKTAAEGRFVILNR